MNVLKELTENAVGKVLIKDALCAVEYNFKWNAPADPGEIEKFEKETGCKIPYYYKEFLQMNGNTWSVISTLFSLIWSHVTALCFGDGKEKEDFFQKTEASKWLQIAPDMVSYLGGK